MTVDVLLTAGLIVGVILLVIRAYSFDDGR